MPGDKKKIENGNEKTGESINKGIKEVLSRG